jgi:hypothetical protein
MPSDEFKAAEIRVAAFSELTAEQGRALYAAYVQKCLELSRLRGAYSLHKTCLKCESCRLADEEMSPEAADDV